MRLPAHYRTTLLLRHYHGLGHQEIADREGIALDTVTTRLRRGMEILRLRLSRAPSRDAFPRPVARVLGPLAGVLLLVGACWAVWRFAGTSRRMPPPPAIAQTVDYDFDAELEEGPLRLHVLHSVQVTDEVRLDPDGQGFRLLRTYSPALRRVQRTDSRDDPAAEPAAHPATRTVSLEPLVIANVISHRQRPSLDLETLFLANAGVGDRWRVPVGHLLDVLSPADLTQDPEPVGALDLQAASILAGPGRWWTHAAHGTVEIEVTELREVDGETLAICEVVVELDEEVDWLASRAPPAAQEAARKSLIGTARATLEGELWWNLEDGRGRRLALSGPIDLVVRSEAPLREGDESLHPGIAEHQYSGRVSWRIQVAPGMP